MYLESLDMVGFKSFAERTHLEFARGTTCVIGANGTGKSNIVDAIKWVIGTQAVSSMRAKAWGDVIFNGTVDENGKTLRPRSDFAEVSLVFSNEDRALKIDVDHVEIRRRITRNDNDETKMEYAINRQECKFGDIKVLFMDTGIGKNAYSVLEQGKIDWIVKAKPEDRRVIFEEAAGISGPKQEEKAAQSRLESAEEALKTVMIQFKSIERDYNKLKDQSLKAREYKKDASQLKDLEYKLAVLRLKQCEDNLGKIQKNIDADNAKLDKLKIKSEKLESAKEENKKNIEGIVADINEKQIELARLEQGAEGDRLSLQSAEELIKELENQQSERLAQIKSTEQQYKDNKNSADEFRKEHANAQKEYDALDRKITENNKRLSDIAAESAKLENAEAELSEELKTEEEKLSALYKSLTEKAHGVIQSMSSFSDKDEYRKVEGASKKLQSLLESLSSSFQSVLDGREGAADEHRRIIDEIMELFAVYQKDFPQLFEMFGEADDGLADAKKADDAVIEQNRIIREIHERAGESARSMTKLREESAQIASDNLAGNEAKTNLFVQLSILSDKISRLENEYQPLVDRKNQIQAEYDACEQDLKARRNDYNARVKAAGEKGQRIEKLGKSIGILAEKKEKLVSDMDKLSSENGDAEVSLHTSIAANTVRLENEKDEMERLKEEFFEEHGDTIENVRESVKLSEGDKLPIVDDKVRRLRKQIKGYGNINFSAEEEFTDVERQYKLMKEQLDDYTKARDELGSVVDEYKRRSSTAFYETFMQISEKFQEVFARLSGGGKAELELLDDDVLTSGVEIRANPLHKNPCYIQMLSGGESAMTAIALLFALYKVKPSPFCILDEIDAPLDPKNVSGFINGLNDFKEDSQFIIITHNQQTVLCADALLGVTQVERGVSKVAGYGKHMDGDKVVVTDKNGRVVDVKFE